MIGFKSKTRIIFAILFSLILLLIVFNFYFLERILVKKPGSCLILEEKYCTEGKAISDPVDPNGLIVVYKLPVGTPIFAAEEGYYSDTPTFYFWKDNINEKVSYPGISISISDDNTAKNTHKTFSYIFYKKDGILKTIMVKKGKFVGTVSENSITFLGDYNLAIRVTNQINKEGKYFFSSDNEYIYKTIINK